MNAQPWSFAVLKVDRVVDGDTVDLLVDVGFRLTALQRFRLLGIDTPERGQLGWGEATVALTHWLDQSGPLRVYSWKSDSFGRWLGDIRRENGETASTFMVTNGFAVPYTKSITYQKENDEEE